MRSLTVPQWGSIFLGKAATQSTSAPYRPKPGDMGRWLTCLHMSPTAPNILAQTGSAAEFFRVEKDLALLIPRNEWTESFYSLKNGFTAPNCPAQFIYYAKAIYEKYRIGNLIGPMLPRELKARVGKLGYFGAGYTARDVICNFITPNFQPITEGRLIVRCGDWFEAYIPSTDMVAALPLEIGRLLRDEDLHRIEFKPGAGLYLEGKPLAAFGGGQGVTNSFYDLR